MQLFDIIREQARAIEAKRAHAVVTITHSDGSTPRSSGKMLVFPDGSICGSIGGGAVEQMAIRDAVDCIRRDHGGIRSYELTRDGNTNMTCGGNMKVLVEVFNPRPLLVMCGAGHVGGAVLRCARFLGYETMLLDDRAAELIADKIALADSFRHVSDFKKDIPSLHIPSGAYFVIATPGHAKDMEALLGAMTQEPAYLGMIGSRSKVGAIFALLREKGIGEDVLRSIYAPIGLDLGGETPEEIAFSILAQIQTVKNDRDGRHLSHKK